MRLLRGLATAVGCFFLWIVCSALGSFWYIGEYGLFSEVEFDLLLLPVWISVPLIGSFLGIFVAPLYYWIIEPIKKHRESG